MNSSDDSTTMGSFGLAATIAALRQEGYTYDFNLDIDNLDEDYVIDHVFRFDVWTDPSDQSILYALHSRATGEKGILVNGYGIYSEPQNNSKIQHIDRWEDQRHNQV